MDKFERQRQLAKLYAALANDLVKWQVEHEGIVEAETPASDPPPVVWQIHQEMITKLPYLKHEMAVEEAEKALWDKDDRDLEDMQHSVNGVLLANRDRLKDGYELSINELRRLALLMRVSANKHLAPYQAPPDSRGW